MSEAPENIEQKRRSLKITLDTFTMQVAPRVRKDRKYLRLYFACTNGFPNVNVETDEEGEATKENGWLSLSSRLNSTNFGVFLGFIEQATKEEAGWKRKIECHHTYKDGVQHETPVHVNDLIVGVDNQGLVFISILQAGRTSSKYVFGPSDWHNYKDGDGNNLSQKETNAICAKETARCLRETMFAAVALDAMDKQNNKAGLPSPSAKPEVGGYQKKDWNNSGGGNNGYQKKPYNGGQSGGYNNNGSSGGYQKKPYNGNSGGGGGNYPKKQWNNNNGGGGGGYNNNNGGGGNGQGNWNKGNNNSYQKPAAVETEIGLDELDY